MPTSLVTGGAGFIGSHVADCCLQAGHRVVVLDDLSGGFRENVPPGADFVEGSVVDADLVGAIFAKERFDYVFHLGAYAAEGLSHFIRRFNYQNNVLGSVNLINAAVNTGNVRRFVFTSSIAVYGASQTPMVEEMIPQPEDPYGVAKYAVELDLKAAAEMFELPFTVFRPHNVYGERQNVGDRYRNVIGIFMNQVMQGLPMKIFGDGLQTRAFTHIDDVAPVIADCIVLPATENEVYNVGADEPHTVLEVGQQVAVAFGVDPDIQHLEARKEVVHAFSSHEKVRRDFPGRPDPVPLDEGIARMAAWARDHGPRQTELFTGIEVLRNMPPSWRREFERPLGNR